MKLLNLLHSTTARCEALGMWCQDEGFVKSFTAHWLMKACFTWGPKEDWLGKVKMGWFTTVGSTKIVQNYSIFFPKVSQKDSKVIQNLWS